jgi:hypothetical protein
MDELLVGWMMSGRTPFTEDGPEARDRMHRAALHEATAGRHDQGATALMARLRLPQLAPAATPDCCATA